VPRIFSNQIEALIEAANLELHHGNEKQPLSRFVVTGIHFLTKG
jgi:hypothetical protein